MIKWKIRNYKVLGIKKRKINIKLREGMVDPLF